VLCAAKALGIPAERKGTKAISFKIKLDAGDEPQEARILLDSGATANFVSQRWVKKTGLRNAGPPRRVNAIDGHAVMSYGNHMLKIRARDELRVIQTQKQVFEAVDLEGYDAILGWPWLQEVNPDIN
jgi:hypothetical protein